jgi:antitoxin HicB
MKYHFKISKERKGYSAECVELEGCITQGDSKKELEKNMAEALNLYLDEPFDSKAVFPLPKEKVQGNSIVKVAVEPKVAFAFALRRERLRSKLTQREAALKIGITGSLNNYQRLESSKTANPEWETVVKIKSAFPEFPLEKACS